MQFLNEYSSLLEWLGFLSVLTFIGSLIAIPWIIAKLPVNYFIRHRQLVAESHSRHPLIARLTFVLRNFVGIVFLIAGFVLFTYQYIKLMNSNITDQDVFYAVICVAALSTLYGAIFSLIAISVSYHNKKTT